MARAGNGLLFHRHGTADLCVAFVRALGHASPDALPRVLLGSLTSAARAADQLGRSGARH